MHYGMMRTERKSQRDKETKRQRGLTVVCVNVSPSTLGTRVVGPLVGYALDDTVETLLGLRLGLKVVGTEVLPSTAVQRLVDDGVGSPSLKPHNWMCVHDLRCVWMCVDVRGFAWICV
jgi:hypothetical protein